MVYPEKILQNFRLGGFTPPYNTRQCVWGGEGGRQEYIITSGEAADSEF